MGSCKNCCAMYLFFSYAAASVIYLIIAIFASTGNVAVLMEHMKEENDAEKNAVKKRTYRQYYLGAATSLIIAVVLFIFCIWKKNKVKRETYLPTLQKIISQDEPGMIGDNDSNSNMMANKTESMPIEMAIDNNKINEFSDSGSGTEEGMKEVIN